MKKLRASILAALVAVSGTIFVNPAEAACYFGSDGVLVVDPSGQCVIQLDPLAPIPNESPSPGNTMSPVPGETPAKETPKDVRITVSVEPNDLLKQKVNSITIENLSDPSKTVICGNAFTCLAMMAPGTPYQINMVATKDFFIYEDPILNGPDGDTAIARDFAGSKILIANFVATKSNTWNYSFVNFDQEFEVTGSQINRLRYTLQSEKTLVRTGKSSVENDVYYRAAPLVYKVGDKITLTEISLNGVHISWKGLPEGLVADSKKGVVTGVLEESGAFQFDGLVAKMTFQNKAYVRVNLIVEGLKPPTNFTATATGPLNARVTFNNPNPKSALPLIEYYQVNIRDLKNNNTWTSIIDGSSLKGDITSLYPKGSFEISLQACSYARSYCSPKSKSKTVVQPDLAQKYSSINSAITVDNALVSSKGKLMDVKLSGRTGDQFTLRPRQLVSMSQAERQNFTKITGWKITKNGSISGVLGNGQIKFTPVKIGGYTFTFTMEGTP